MEAATKKWIIDPGQSEIGFSIKHLLASEIRGTFRHFEADIYNSGDDRFNFRIEFLLNPASFDTGNEKRDTRLVGPDFFDTGRFPEIRFTGHTQEKVGQNGLYRLIGDLTIKGITNKIDFDMEFGGMTTDEEGIENPVFEINGILNRSDWGLHWNSPMDTGEVMLSEQIRVNCNIRLLKFVFLSQYKQVS